MLCKYVSYERSGFLIVLKTELSLSMFHQSIIERIQKIVFCHLTRMTLFRFIYHNDLCICVQNLDYF